MPSGTPDERKRLQQVCVIPFRQQTGSGVALEFCLITSLQKKRWIFPKGIIDPGETLAETAHKEIWEEAGLRGELIAPALGCFVDQKWGCELDVEVMLLHVTQSADDWPERSQRPSLLTTAEQALAQLHRDELKELLRQACRRLQRA